MKAKKFIVCPNCGSKNIDPISLTGAGITGFGLPDKYYCNNCGYTGIPLEVTKRQYEKLEFKPKRYTKRKKKVKEESDFVRAVVVLTILVFFALSVFVFFPGPEQAPAENRITPVTEQESSIPKWELFVNPRTEDQDVSRATGISSVQAFALPIFLLVLTVGVLSLGIYSHWHRMRLFE